MELINLCPNCGFSKELHSPIWGCQSVMLPNENTNPYHARLKTGITFENIVGDLLTDRKIGAYEDLGYYQPEARKARKERSEKKKKGKSNFIERDGRLIYSLC